LPYVIGIDVGGTFTDCVICRVPEGQLVADKAFTVPEHVGQGMVQAVRNTAARLDLSAEAVLGETEALALGTTQLTNRLVSRTGARVGFITTRGFEDTQSIARVYAKTEGLSELEKQDPLTWAKPTLLVAREAIKGVTERVDYKGAVIVPLNEREVAEAVEALVAQGVEAIAVGFLWAFMNPAHEEQVERYVRERHPDVYVVTSHKVAPVVGEYERFNSVLLSAYLGPAAARESRALREPFGELGYQRECAIMQCNGGLIRDAEIAETPLTVVGSGPVGGLIASAHLAKRLGYPYVIATDMGGTSFEVGLIVGEKPAFSTYSTLERFRCYVPAVEVVSIGAGGGSIAYVDPIANTLHVGPRSAGSVPGPVCYDQGGTEPTVTDADVVLGRIDPRAFFGARQTLDRDGAARAIEERIARPLGLSLLAAAQGIVDIVDARMADLIRSRTIERGYDPREFVLFAYGGAAPVHASAYARELGVQQVLVSPFAAAFSALGVAAADRTRFYSKSEPMRSPFDVERVNTNFGWLRTCAEDDLARGGQVEPATLSLLLDLRFGFQAHEIRVDVPRWPLTADDLQAVVQRFTELYEQRFGARSAVANAPVEIVAFHVASAVPGPALTLGQGDAAPARQDARIGTRAVYFDGFVETPVLAYDRLAPGDRASGPAIVEAPNTTVVLHPGDEAEVDALRNVVLRPRRLV
jgi:N-methylhydantoinase A